MPGITSSGRRSTGGALRPARRPSRVRRRRSGPRRRRRSGRRPRSASRPPRAASGRGPGARTAGGRATRWPSRGCYMRRERGVTAQCADGRRVRPAVDRAPRHPALHHGRRRAFARYRSIPEVARYQSWEAPYSLDRARSFVGWMEPTTPTSAASGTSSRSRPARTRHAHRRLCVPGPRGRAADRRHRLLPRPRGPGQRLRHRGDHRARPVPVRGPEPSTRSCADCDIRNEPSWKLLERVGFRREGEMHEAFWDGTAGRANICTECSRRTGGAGYAGRTP